MNEKVGGARIFRIAIITFLILCVVYAVSVYTRKHETKDLPTDNITESPLKDSRGIK